jgi:hypothetical protein
VIFTARSKQQDEKLIPDLKCQTKTFLIPKKCGLIVKKTIKMKYRQTGFSTVRGVWELVKP